MTMTADAILMPVSDSIFDRESAIQCYAELMTLPRVVSGRCKVGESVSAAAIRELVEETQLNDVALHYIFEFWGARTRHYVFAARVPEHIEPVPSHEISRCRWIRAKDIHSAWVSVSTRGIVQVLLEKSSPMGPARRSSPLRVFERT